ncbi:MAG TPA: four helix bundle protein [Chitinophagaceae bacterium]|jgi:four helix bundle protein|nr:four helix bundle protein [Chitinophagaceae bacterium]
MATVHRFEDLEIWQLARSLYQKISKLAEKIKRNHDYRFADQIKAAAGSIMDNIAEGFERNSRLEFLNSLSISKGESGELKSQLYRAIDDDYLNKIEFDELYEDTDKVSKKIANFVKYLNTSNIKGLKFKDRADV